MRFLGPIPCVFRATQVWRNERTLHGEATEMAATYVATTSQRNPRVEVIDL